MIMKSKFLFLILPLMAVVSCAGVDQTGDDFTPQAPYTLSVDKTSIESDGKDCATFILTDANGKVLTDVASFVSKIYYINEATGERLNRKTTSFRTVEDGTYTFSATFKGEKCANSVTITSANRTKYEVFKKNVCIYRFTATWCSNCPAMTAGLSRIDNWTKGRVVELDIHGAGSVYQYSDGSRYVADYLIYQVFNAPGYPSCVYDLDLMSDTRDYTEIEGVVFDRIADNPATCGIKASSSFENGKLTVSARIKSSTGGKYDIGFAVLKDNCVPTPASDIYESVYNDVVIAMTGNYATLSSSHFTLVKDAESAEVSQTTDMTITENASDYSVVAFALREKDGKTIIDNVVELPLNGSVDYAYN